VNALDCSAVIFVHLPVLCMFFVVVDILVYVCVHVHVRVFPPLFLTPRALDLYASVHSGEL